MEKAQREEKSMMQQARQAKTLQAIAIMRHSCQVKVLTGWHEYIVSKKHHKKMIDNLRNAIQKKISRQSFGMWQEPLVAIPAALGASAHPAAARSSHAAGLHPTMGGRARLSQLRRAADP